ncbi:MAG: AraC family transcriptional regulator [Muribaculaceae bacterium]|nr:AraC family transcriptional regulator [Muribaculaceae bacterium]
MKGAEAHTDLSKLPVSLLLIEGERCMENDSLEGRAEVAFNLIVNRYYENQTDTALRHAAVIALRHIGNLNLTHNIDYRKAYRNLHLARQIATDDGNDYQLAFILNSLASLYSTNIGDNDSVEAEAKRLLLQSLQTSLQSNNQSLLPTVGISIAYSNFSKGNWDIFDKDIHKIDHVKFDSVNTRGGETVKTVIKATDAFFAKDYDKCEILLQQARQSMPDERFSERYAYTFDLLLMNLYLQRSDTLKAIGTIKNILHTAERNNYNDYVLIMSYHLARIYENLNQPDSLEKYYNRYLNLKDVMKVENGYGEVATMDLLAEIEQTNKELENLSIRHQIARRNFMLTVCIFIILSILTLALLYVYRNLKRTNKNMFIRNEEALKRELQHKLLRREWDKDRASLESRISELTATLASMTEVPAKKEEIADAVPTGEDIRPDNISESDKEMYMRLYTSILNVMEEEPMIFQYGFSLSDLSDLLHVSSRTVSRAINICHNSNFSQLLNEYRMREVTRLMHDPLMSNLTIEAIAEKAGFKSRTSFSRLFKSMIGLTPSEYLKMAKEQKEG